jgi:hypothetical protein
MNWTKMKTAKTPPFIVKDRFANANCENLVHAPNKINLSV